MSEIRSHNNPTQSAADALRAAFLKKQTASGVEVVRAAGNERAPLNEAPINSLFLPGGIGHDGDETVGVSPEMARVQHHANARDGASVGGRNHGDKTYHAARAACEPKKK